MRMVLPPYGALGKFGGTFLAVATNGGPSLHDMLKPIGSPTTKNDPHILHGIQKLS